MSKGKSAQVPPALVNANQIQQILLNLLINARQAMPQGGRLLIKLDHDPENNMVVLVVRDNGSGIPADRLRRIFDPFFSTKDGPDETGKGGTGLGLSSCRNIVEAHRGRIRVQSTVGKGTAFTIMLPVADAASAPATKCRAGCAHPDANGSRSTDAHVMSRHRRLGAGFAHITGWIGQELQLRRASAASEPEI